MIFAERTVSRRLAVTRRIGTMRRYWDGDDTSVAEALAIPRPVCGTVAGDSRPSPTRVDSACQEAAEFRRAVPVAALDPLASPGLILL